MTATWQKCIRLKEPLLTKPFYVFAGLAAVALLLGLFRELTGLGYVTGLNDGYSWGLFKNWNVTALTALGSGGYAVAVMAWIFNERKFHPILRTAVLTSLLGYGTGMLALGVDVGRPWNFIHMNNPRNWNPHSVLLEVAVCMTAYALLALDMENMPPFLERIYRGSDPQKSARALKFFNFMQKTFPFGIALAFVLPSMHQSSLGSLMYLAGNRVNTLWQTPRLPLLYLLMAYILGFACVLLVLLLSSYAWDLGRDSVILGKLASVMSWMTLVWLAIQFIDLGYRGVVGQLLIFNRYSVCFLTETILLLIPAIALRSASVRATAGSLFRMTFLLTLGGLLYRFTPTTIAFNPLGDYRYFPSVAEILMSIGFTSIAVVIFLFAVKKFAILPASAGKIAAEAAMPPFDTL
ncbi:MAG TPA: Ni/Fe-hydrogenase cytochrome b subunit [Candidatus Acidoferrum sp.]|jgi:Ni/Fe-hydrogenase subunit HybB-like protein